MNRIEKRAYFNREKPGELNMRAGRTAARIARRRRKAGERKPDPVRQAQTSFTWEDVVVRSQKR